VVPVYVEIVRSALEELADAAYQQEAWTGRRPEEISSFEECVEQLFGDSGLSLALDRSQQVFGPGVDSDLRTLNDLVGRIEARRSPEDIIRDPAMLRVRQVAKQVLRALDDSPRSGVI
jgi:hypothetical protein